MITPRRILQINATSTAASAIAMLAMRRVLPALFGLDEALILDVIAVAFLVYAAALVAAARREPVARQALMAFAIADAAYVVASAAVLAFYWPQFAPFGRALIVAVALVVEAFAILQYRAAGATFSRISANA